MVPGVIKYILEYRGLSEPPGKLLGLMGLSGKRGGAFRAGRAPRSPLVRIGLGRGGGAPLSLSLFPPSFWPLSSIPVWPNKAHIFPGEFP